LAHRRLCVSSKAALIAVEHARSPSSALSWSATPAIVGSTLAGSGRWRAASDFASASVAGSRPSRPIHIMSCERIRDTVSFSPAFFSNPKRSTAGLSVRRT
jgi:hypothetical protein